jgi:hypothetical protein
MIILENQFCILSAHVYKNFDLVVFVANQLLYTFFHQIFQLNFPRYHFLWSESAYTFSLVR